MKYRSAIYVTDLIKAAKSELRDSLPLKEAALKLGFVTADEFDLVVDPAKMVRPYVAGK